jgi:hypothetical protein
VPLLEGQGQGQGPLGPLPAVPVAATASWPGLWEPLPMESEVLAGPGGAPAIIGELGPGSR